MITTGFRFRAATRTGEEVAGVVQAGSMLDAMDELRRQTLVPIALEPVASGAPRGRRWHRASRDDDALAGAIRTLATMVAGGAPLDRALRFTAERAPAESLRLAMAGVHADVQLGESLSAALRARPQVFGTLAPALVRAGEEGGALDQALAQLADLLDHARDLRAHLRAALWYPALLGVVTSIGVVILLALVVPRFAGMLAEHGQTLPASTRALIAASNALASGWWACLLLFAGAAAMASAWLQRPGNRARWHALRLRLPVVGPLEHTLATARFTRALGMLLQGGVGLLGAMRVARQSVTNEALADRLAQATEAVARGQSLAASLSDVLSPIACQLITVSEEHGSLHTMALRIAQSDDAQVQRLLRSLVALVEPVLIVVFGGLVGFVALAMLQAVYAINVSTF